MGKTLFTLAITLTAGVISIVVAHELLGGFTEFGPVAAAAVAGACAVYFDQKQ